MYFLTMNFLKVIISLCTLERLETDNLTFLKRTDFLRLYFSYIKIFYRPLQMLHAYLFVSIKIWWKKNKNPTHSKQFLFCEKNSKLGSWFFFSFYFDAVLSEIRFFVDKNLSSQSVASFFVCIYFRRIDERAVKRGNKKNTSKV